MDKRKILKLTSEELNVEAAKLKGFIDIAVEDGEIWCTHQMWDGIRAPIPNYLDRGIAMDCLFESVYGNGGKIKDGAWVLGTVHNGRDCAHACLMWKDKSFTKFRPLKVEVDCPRGEMARAITLCWVCAMLGVNDVS